MNQPARGFRIPWWLIVGAIGFMVFGGWRGFFGAIFGVVFLPIALFAGLAILVIGWALITGKRFSRFPPQGQPFQRPPEANQARDFNRNDVIDAEATVIKEED